MATAAACAALHGDASRFCATARSKNRCMGCCYWLGYDGGVVADRSWRGVLQPYPRFQCAKRDSPATDLDFAVLQHWSSDTVMSDFATWALAVFLWRRHPPTAPPPADSSESLVPGVASEKDEQQTL